MECHLLDIIQPYHMCMWLLMIAMAAGIAAMMSRLTGGRGEDEHEDLRPKSEEEIAALIDKIKAERKNDQVLHGATTVSIRGRTREGKIKENPF